MSLDLISTPLSGFDPELQQKASDFAREHIAPKAESWETTRRYPRDVVRLASQEFGGFLVTTEHGGKGYSPTDFLMMVEEFAKADIAFTLAFVVHHHVGLVTSLSGNATLRDWLLPDLISGNKIGAFCLTEPKAGSDAAGVETWASGDRDSLSLSGRKAWVTSGAVADVLAVFAKTDQGKDARSMGCFAVDAAAEGVTRGDRYDLIAGHVAQVCEISFDKVALGEADTLFPAGQGFATAMGALDVARLGIAAMCTGALTSALETALAYAGNRRMFGATTLDQQGIQWEFAKHLTALEASRSLLFQTARLFENNKPATLAAAQAKKFANHAANEGLGWAMRAMGAEGTRRRNPLARQQGAAQLLFNTDGTPEIMNVVIGRSLAQAFPAKAD